MKWFAIEPRDTALFRDGRPFSATPGAQARSLPFPHPSTVAGALRTRLGTGRDGHFDTDTEAVARVASRGIVGPLLARIGDDGERFEAGRQVFVPAPRDAQWFGVAPVGEVGTADEHAGGDARRERDEKAELRILRPRRLHAGDGCDLPDGLMPLAFGFPLQGKPLSRPRYWRLDKAVAHLTETLDEGVRKLSEIGSDGPDVEARVHVALRDETRVADEGMLFVTHSLRFDRGKERLALLAAVDGAPEQELARVPGIAPFGGERRLAGFRACEVGGLECPEEIVKRVAQTRRLRVQLATPARFGAGWRPGAFLHGAGLGGPPRLRLVAARVDRPVVVSGWDLALSRAKPTFRCAPAGSVYFFELFDGADARTVVTALWLRSVSDDEADRRSGFGLALVGSWTPSEGRA